MGIIEEGLGVLIRNGLVQLLVFALIYVVVFGVLRNVGLFATLKDKDGKDLDKAHKKKALDKVKKIHSVIAIVIGIMVLLPHYYAPFSQYDIIPIIERSIPEISLLVLGILCAMIILGLIGMKLGGRDGNPIRLFVFVAAVIAVIWIVMEASNRRWIPQWVGQEFWAVVIAVVVFAAIVAWVMGPTRDTKDIGTVFGGSGSKKWRDVKLKDVFDDFGKR
jgi:O-antigen/teichoic acid export membrane protein